MTLAEQFAMNFNELAADEDMQDEFWEHRFDEPHGIVDLYTRYNKDVAGDYHDHEADYYIFSDGSVWRDPGERQSDSRTDCLSGEPAAYILMDRNVEDTAERMQEEFALSIEPDESGME